MDNRDKINTVLALSAGTNNKYQLETGQKIGEYLRTLPLKPLLIPMISNSSGEPYETVEDTIEALVTNCSEVAMVEKSVQFLQR